MDYAGQYGEQAYVDDARNFYVQQVFNYGNAQNNPPETHTELKKLFRLDLPLNIVLWLICLLLVIRHLLERNKQSLIAKLTHRSEFAVAIAIVLINTYYLATKPFYYPIMNVICALLLLNMTQDTYLQTDPKEISKRMNNYKITAIMFIVAALVVNIYLYVSYNLE